MRRSAAALALAALAILSACGSDGGSGGDESPKAATSLTVAVTLEEGAEPAKTYELQCDPAGGDHPQAKQACATLAAAGAGVFDPIPDKQPCTMIYGGPQTATVTGTFEGKQVDASFSRENGCEIDRWDKLGTTFFDVPML